MTNTKALDHELTELVNLRAQWAEQGRDAELCRHLVERLEKVRALAPPIYRRFAESILDGLEPAGRQPAPSLADRAARDSVCR